MAAEISFKANLGKDPEYKEVTKGGEVQKIVSFSACETTYRTNQETGEIEGSDDTWYQVSLVGEKAKHYSNVLKKGMRVLVQGTFKPGSPYKDNNGEYQNSFAVYANEVTLCMTQRIESVVLKEKEAS
jgi:single-stranded DNA-binding protein